MYTLDSYWCAESDALDEYQAQTLSKLVTYIMVMD